jgi:hypothetical protein
MCRTAEFVPMNYISLAYPGFRPTREGIDSVAEKLGSLVITENYTVILDLVSNVAFMGTDKDGLPTASIKGGDGKYHVPGVLTTAPPTTLKKNLEGCNAIAEIIKMANVILMCLTPRYVLEKCCNDPAHIENHSSMDFDDEIVEYQEQHRRVLGGWATTRGLEFCIMDPTAIVNPTEPLLRNRVTSGGSSIWCAGDPVHLSREAYKDLVMLVYEAHEGTSLVGESASVSTGSGHAVSGSRSRGMANGTEKRRVPDAVITMPMPTTTKRGRYAQPPATAGWLRGLATNVRGDRAQAWVGWRGGNRGQRGQHGHWANRGRGAFGCRW